MDLHGIASGAVGTVNPFIAAQLLRSTGYATAADGTQVPSYAAPQTVSIQVQALTFTDLTQLDGLNIQGTRRAVYLRGNWDGVVQASQQGGDLLRFPDRPGGTTRTWLAALVLESWPDWTKLAVTLQVNDIGG